MSAKIVLQRQKILSPVFFLYILLITGLGHFSYAGETNVIPALRAEKNLRTAKERLAAEPNNVEAAWQFARACFERAEFATNDTERAALADQGISAARQLLKREPKLAAAHYYLALNLGELAQTKSFGALKLVDELEKEFSLTLELDEKIDFAGPDRGLGFLYRDAPGWPVSLGSRSKARQHFLRARQISPDFPENQLNLVETFIKWGDDEAAQREAKKFEEMLPAARKKFAGEEWQSSWTDWDRRWTIALRKINQKTQSRSPHSRK